MPDGAGCAKLASLMRKLPTPILPSPLAAACLSLGLSLCLALAQPAYAEPALAQSAPAAAEKPAKWHWPLEGAKARVSSFFGALRGRRAHGGVDFSTPVGTPVKATDSGVVVASTNRYEGDKKYGEVVVIEHMNGFRSLYAHLNSRDVKVGDEVAAGQSIGESGKTGHSTGPHLHLEAFYNGTRTDPKNLLAGLDETALPSALTAKQYTSTDGSFVTKSPYTARPQAGGKRSAQKHITKRPAKSSKKSGRK